MLVGVMTTLYSNIRNLIIGKKYSGEELAYSTKAEQFPSTIAGNINSSISKVLFPVLANYQDDLSAVKRIMRRAIKVGNYILFPILLGFACVADNFVSVLLTDKWLKCVPYLQIMCVVYALQPIQTSSLQAVKALGKGQLYLVVDIIKKVFGILVLVITVVAFNSVLVIVFGALVTELFATLINFPINKKYFEYSYLEQLLDLVKPSLMTVTMCACVLLVGMLELQRWLLLIVQIAAGGLVYLSLSLITKDETYMYIKNLALSYLGKRKCAL